MYEGILKAVAWTECGPFTACCPPTPTPLSCLPMSVFNKGEKPKMNNKKTKQNKKRLWTCLKKSTRLRTDLKPRFKL